VVALYGFGTIAVGVCLYLGFRQRSGEPCSEVSTVSLPASGEQV